MPTEYSIWTTADLGFINDQAAPNGRIPRAPSEQPSTNRVACRVRPGRSRGENAASTPAGTGSPTGPPACML